jgi:hypothetical protein
MLLSEMAADRVARAEFQITNVRQLPMCVQLVDKSCGCESLDIPKEPLAPAAIDTIGMIVRPTAARAERKTYLATLRLVWPDQTDTLRLRTEFQVLADLVTEPTAISCDFVSEDSCEHVVTVMQRVRSKAEPGPTKPEFRQLPEEVEVTACEHGSTRELWNAQRGESKLEDGEITITDRQHLVDATNGESKDSIWEIEWRATLRLHTTDRVRQNPEAFVTQCLLACGDCEAARVQIPIRLRCVETIQSSPAHSYFGSVKSGDERRRTVLLRSRDDAEFQIVEITCDSPAFVATAKSPEAKRLHNIQLVFAETEPGKHTGTVRVKTTHSKCPEVKLTVEGVVTE